MGLLALGLPLKNREKVADPLPRMKSDDLETGERVISTSGASMFLEADHSGTEGTGGMATSDSSRSLPLSEGVGLCVWLIGLGTKCSYPDDLCFRVPIVDCF